LRPLITAYPFEVAAIFQRFGHSFAQSWAGLVGGLISHRGTNLITKTLNLLGFHTVERLRGQPPAALSKEFFDLGPIDRPLLTALLQRWQQTFRTASPALDDLRLFRSLNMPNAAARLHDPRPRFGRETVLAKTTSRSRHALSFPGMGPTVMMTGVIGFITGILSVLGGEQFSPYAVFFYLAATVVIGLKFGTILAIASAWLSVMIGGIVLYEPRFTLTIDNPVSMWSLVAFVCVAMMLSTVLHRFRARAFTQLFRF
jgi:hypothetical protein